MRSNRPKSHDKKKLGATSIALALLSGCFQTPFSTTASISASSGGAAVLSTTTDSGGRTSGAYDPNAPYAQKLVAATGDIAGTSVVLPPGSLSIATTISVESGASLAAGSAMSDLGLAASNAIAAAGAAVIIRPSENATLRQPMSLSIPLPAGYALTGLSLADDDKLAILAKVFDASGELKSKLIPRKDITIENGTARFATMAFGAFQTVVLNQAVTEAVEVKSTEPIANKNGVAVITTSGVVSAADIATIEQKKALTFTRFTVTFTATSRALSISAELSESLDAMKHCRLIVRDSASKAVRAAFDKNSGESSSSASSSASTGEGPRLPGDVSGLLEVLASCEAPDGRVARSDAVSIGNVPTASTSAPQSPDTTPPGTNGALAASNIGSTSLTIAWAPATDNVGGTAAADLEYRIVYTYANNPADIDSVTKIIAIPESNSELPRVAKNWTKNLITANVTGLSQETAYTFAVAVRDLAGNVTAYPPLANARTNDGQSSSDTTPPNIGGNVTADNFHANEFYFYPGWAWDNVTPYNELMYKVVRSANAADIDTVSKFNGASTVINGWTANRDTYSKILKQNGDPPGLMAYTVGVKDAAGNVAIFPPVMLKYLDGSMTYASCNSEQTYFTDRTGAYHVNGQQLAPSTGQTAPALFLKIGLGNGVGSMNLIQLSQDKPANVVDSSGVSSQWNGYEPLPAVSQPLPQATAMQCSIFNYNGTAELVRMYTQNYVGNFPFRYTFENNPNNVGSGGYEHDTSVPYHGGLTGSGGAYSSSTRKTGSHALSLGGSAAFSVPGLTPTKANYSQPLSSFTIAGWVYLTATSGTVSFFGFDNAVEIGRMFNASTNAGNLAVYLGGYGQTIINLPDLSPNTWHHVAVTSSVYSGNFSANIFLNGAQVHAVNQNNVQFTRFDPSGTTYGDFKVGQSEHVFNSTTPNLLNGFVDDLVVVPWTLSPTAIHQLANP